MKFMHLGYQVGTYAQGWRGSNKTINHAHKGEGADTSKHQKSLSSVLHVIFICKVLVHTLLPLASTFISVYNTFAMTSFLSLKFFTVFFL